MLKRLVLFAITSGLAMKVVRAVLDARQAKTNGAAARHAKEVQRWEDEGGTPATPSTSTGGMTR
jgi:hypothetical protein